MTAEATRAIRPCSRHIFPDHAVRHGGLGAIKKETCILTCLAIVRQKRILLAGDWGFGVHFFLFSCNTFLVFCLLRFSGNLRLGGF